MRQRGKGVKIYYLVLKILKQVIEKKALKLEAKGYTTISSKEIYRYCIKMVEEENKCIGITTYAARLLNRYGIRLNTHRAQWRITTDLLKKLFNFDESYEELKNTPLNRLDNIHFLYVVTALLYEAKPGGGEDGDGG